jgi:hypothetical protein
LGWDFGWVAPLVHRVIQPAIQMLKSSSSAGSAYCSLGVRYRQWSDDTIPWSEITDVTVWRYKRQKVILLHLKHPDRFSARGLVAKFAAINRRLTGGDISISMTATDRSFDEAMAAIQQFRHAS